MDRRVLRILKQVLNVQSIEASHDPILCRTDRYIRRRVSAALSDFLRDTIGDTAIGGEFGTPFSPGGKWQCTWGPATDPDDTNLVFVATYTDAPSVPPTCAIVVIRGTDVDTGAGRLVESGRRLHALR